MHGQYYSAQSKMMEHLYGEPRCSVSTEPIESHFLLRESSAAPVDSLWCASSPLFQDEPGAEDQFTIYTDQH